MTGASDTVELITSELITNACAASGELEGGPYPVGFWLFSDRKQVLVLVWDANPNPPVRMNPAGDVEGGRGLMLVEAMSSQWGSYSSVWGRMEGKIVWALVSE